MIETSKFICVKHNCAWEHDIDEKNCDNGKWIFLSKEMTREEIINTDNLVKVYKYHDGEENKINYVFMFNDSVSKFTEMFSRTWERDNKFNRLAKILRAR